MAEQKPLQISRENSHYFTSVNYSSKNINLTFANLLQISVYNICKSKYLDTHGLFYID